MPRADPHSSENPEPSTNTRELHLRMVALGGGGQVECSGSPSPTLVDLLDEFQPSDYSHLDGNRGGAAVHLGSAPIWLICMGPGLTSRRQSSSTESAGSRDYVRLQVNDAGGAHRLSRGAPVPRPQFHSRLAERPGHGVLADAIVLGDSGERLAVRIELGGLRDLGGAKLGISAWEPTAADVLLDGAGIDLEPNG